MYSIFSQCGKQAYGIVHYVVDTKAELTDIELTYLPMGCMAYVIDDKKYYILNGQKEWKEFYMGGGDTPDPPEPEDVFPVYNQADLVEFLTNPDLPNEMKVMADLNLNMDIIINGEDSRGNYKAFYLNNKNIELNDYKIIVKNEGTLTLREGGNIFANNNVIECINGGLQTQESSVHIESYNDTAIKATNESYIMLNGEVEITAEENCVLLSDGSNLRTENGVTLTSHNNFVIGGDENAQSNNPIAIDLYDTTIYANSYSSGYLACGIYLPIEGNVQIYETDIYAQNGCGICQRIGNVSINENTSINTSAEEGKDSGKIGNSDTIIHASGVVYDQISHYNTDENNFNLIFNSDTYYIKAYYKSIEVLKDEGYQPSISFNGEGTLIPPYEPEPSDTEAYAVFDSTDGSLVFFRDEVGKYTDHQEIDTKTYYAGLETKTYTEESPGWTYKKHLTTSVRFDDVIKPIYTRGWFYHYDDLPSIIGLDKLDTSNVTDMGGMFEYCGALTSLDLSSFDTSKVTYMGQMFTGCSSLTTLNLSGFDTSNVTDMHNMFSQCGALTSIGTTALYTPANAVVNEMFSGCSNLTADVVVSSFSNYEYANAFYLSATVSPAQITLYGEGDITSDDIDAFITSTKTYSPDSNIVNGMANTETYAVYNQNLKTLTFFKDESGKYTDRQEIDDKIYFAGIEEENYNPAPFVRWHNEMLEATFLTEVEPRATKIDWFSNIITLTNISGLENLNTSHITDMSYMFQNCENLISLNISTFDVSNVTDMSYMFAGCDKIESINLEELSALNLTNMSYMFEGCSSVTNINLTGFNAPQVSNVENIFANCSSLTSLDLNWLNTSNIQDTMYGLFDNCHNLTTLNKEEFIIPETVYQISGIFNNCYNLSAKVYLNGIYWDDYSNAFYDAAKDSGQIIISYNDELDYEDVKNYVDANKGEGNVIIQNAI